ncbi:Uncharacterised protein [Helicobacter fennelliae]|uniref:Uncharacterized protein n=1 Tax=Helicobacter fennelliae MRY12-0050 TaxID=1325130 RepID=T1CQR8_9HELI|nr:hypothetical protein HFN_0215 [Helicobacter fennelliae MRY12-0050]STP14420.1 Uncharacterised protein [Helicobacter fennelliae]STQ84446.1 Uncharacterised protein [Helicobacter fennelliae]
MVEIFLIKEQKNIFFNIQYISYRFDVCEKTIYLLLKELQSLDLIKHNFRKNQLVFLSMLDYKQSKIFQSKSQEVETESKQDFSQFPARFFKDMNCIVNRIIKQDTKDFNRTFSIQDKLWKLKVSENKFIDYKGIFLEFEEVNDSQCTIRMPYTYLTNEIPPKLSHPFHKNIIKSKILKGLNAITYREDLQGGCNEKIA